NQNAIWRCQDSAERFGNGSEEHVVQLNFLKTKKQQLGCCFFVFRYSTRTKYFYRYKPGPSALLIAGSRQGSTHRLTGISFPSKPISLLPLPKEEAVGIAKQNSPNPVLGDFQHPFLLFS